MGGSRYPEESMSIKLAFISVVVSVVIAIWVTILGLTGPTWRLKLVWGLFSGCFLWAIIEGILQS